MTGTLITAEVDFDVVGKQSGYLRVPHSVHRSAYGWLPVPITVIRNGVVNVMTELGGGGAVTPDILKRTQRGLFGLLHSLEMLPDYTPDETLGTRELNARGSIYAYGSGLFEPLKNIGDAVIEGEVVGLIHHPDTPQQAPDKITSPYDGMMLCQRAMAPVNRGDAVYQISADAL